MAAPTKQFLDRLRDRDRRLGVKWDDVRQRFFIYIRIQNEGEYRKEALWRGKTTKQQKARRNLVFRDRYGFLCRWLFWVENTDGTPRALDDRVFEELEFRDSWKHGVDKIVEKLEADEQKLDEQEKREFADTIGGITADAYQRFRRSLDNAFGSRNTPRAVGKHFDVGASLGLRPSRLAGAMVQRRDGLIVPASCIS